MSEVKVKATTQKEPGEIPAPSEHREHFTFNTKSGSVIVCGKPRGVLKLRLRQILTKELLEDPEITNIATALLCIVTVDGAPLWLANPNTFEAALNRFSDDEEINAFMEKYNELVNPELMAVVRAAQDEAFTKNIKADQLTDFVSEKILEFTREQRAQVRD